MKVLLWELFREVRKVLGVVQWVEGFSRGPGGVYGLVVKLKGCPFQGGSGLRCDCLVRLCGPWGPQGLGVGGKYLFVLAGFGLPSIAGLPG